MDTDKITTEDSTFHQRLAMSKQDAYTAVECDIIPANSTNQNTVAIEVDVANNATQDC
jgi:hypothetical protein